MSTRLGLASFRQLLGRDFGSDVAGGNAYDGWLNLFRAVPVRTFGDLTFDNFSRLQDVKAYGPFADQVNDALALARWVHQPSTPNAPTVHKALGLTAGNHYWECGATNDNMRAGRENDVMISGAGNDTVFGGRGNDLIFGESGNDSIIGAAGNDTIFGGEGRDIIHGWAGDDFIFGGSGNDGLYGAAGNDTIFGGDGNDYICAGSDHDTVYGGSGRDTFAFRGDLPNSVSVIKDFEVLYDRQGIKSSLTDGHLSIDMIKPYEDGLMIDFGQGRALCFESVWDATALFNSMYLLDA